MHYTVAQAVICLILFLVTYKYISREVLIWFRINKGILVNFTLCSVCDTSVARYHTCSTETNAEIARKGSGEKTDYILWWNRIYDI